MVAQTRAGAQGSQSSPKKLSFHEKLVGRGLSTDALIKKLKVLHTELAALDQENVELQSISVVRKELINTSILLHKDRGVKAYAACCLADILRLYAPDAPYTQPELRDIFQFFFRQLSAGLKGTDSSYYHEYYHLLESLSTVKSVVLVCDLPHAEEVMADVFRDFFGLIRRDLPKKIEIFMADILIALLDECQALPSDVLDIIMSQFMDKNPRLEQSAYRLAVQICNATADKLQRHVCQYFTDIVVSHARDEDFDEVQAAHELIKQLSRSCPALLLSVIPQLEEELRVSEVPLRSMATEVLGEMFADKGGPDLVKKFPTTWNFWLQRKNDKAPAIRLKFVEATKGLVVNLPEQREAIEDALQSKLFDPDEKVRAAVCRLYSQLDYETALHHVSVKQLRSVAGRGLDKKHVVRVEALTSLAKLYSLAYNEIDEGEPAAIRQFAWIPNEIINLVSTGHEVRMVAEQVIYDFVLPLPSSSSSKGAEIDEVAWTDRLLNTMRHIGEKGVKSLLSISGLKAHRPTLYDHYIESCIRYNGGIIDEDEEAVTNRLAVLVQHLAGQFLDPQKASEDLHAFAKMNEGRLFKLLKTCFDTQTDLKGLVKATNEFLKRCEQSSASIMPTMSIILRRGSLRLYNQSSIPTLIKRIQKGAGGNPSSAAEAVMNNAKVLFVFAVKHCPTLFQSHIGELSKAIADEKNPRLVEVCLQALAAASKSDEKLALNDKRTIDRAMKFILSSNARHAKFAARLIASSKNREEQCVEIVESICDALEEAEPELLVAHLTVLAQFARLAPDAFELKSEQIMAFLIKQVLMVPTESESNGMNTDDEWIEDIDMPPGLRAKIIALKVCRQRCLAQISTEEAMDIASPVLKMFITILDCSGSLTPDAVDDPKVKTRLRLQAAISLLRLSAVDEYAKAIAAHFILVAITVQDSCYQVRMTFLTKLVSLLTPRKLDPRFNIIPFLTVHDPEADVKSTAIAYISFASRSLPAQLKVEYLETIFIRLLHCLAHHPDFAMTQEGLMDMAKYVDFYLENISSAENLSLLYHLAMKAKAVRDSQSEAFSHNLYVMSELAQELIKQRAQSRSWSIQSYPGKVKLPSDILRALPNAETANKIIKTVYLPEEAVSWLAESSKAAKAAAHPAKERRRPEQSENKTNGKRKTTAKSNGSVKRSRPIRKRQDSDDDDESSSEIDEADGTSSNEDRTAPDPDADKPLSPREERLGRSARTKAKAKIKEQAKKLGRNRDTDASSDG